MKKKYKKIKLFVGIVVACLGILLIYWSVPYSPQKYAFDKEMRAYADTVQSSTEVVTAEEIATLPPALQKYCNYIGLEGFQKYSVVRTYFNDTDFVFDDKSEKVLKMDYDLWLFYDGWFRSAFCQSGMFGVPFEGRDYCTEQREGGMNGYLGRAVQIFDVCNKQGYQAGLISWFAESLIINPSVLFSDMVSYEQLDEYTVKAILRDNDVKGEGIIYLNEEGAIVAFYSDDRQVEEIDDVMTEIGWNCEYEDYMELNGIKRAQTVKSIKIYPNREVVYFYSADFEVEYLK